MNKALSLACAVGLLLINGSASRAQTPALTAPSPPQSRLVPLQSPAYDDGKALMRAGIDVTSGHGAAAGSKRLTRDAFAVGLARGLGDILSRPPASLQKIDDNDGNAITALIRLVSEFEPELQARGVDTVAARRRFAALSVSRDHWEYQVLDRLRNKPMVLLYDNAARPLMTRERFARETAALLSVRDPVNAPSQPERFRLLTRLVTAFASELRLLGVDVAAAKSRLMAGQKSEPLHDTGVKPGESPAMKAMREAGIFIGYPEETTRAGSAQKRN
jgi:hypothetical protein